MEVGEVVRFYMYFESWGIEFFDKWDMVMRERKELKTVLRFLDWVIRRVELL